MPTCARCGAAAQLLANFCARCGQDLRHSAGLPVETQLLENWTQPEDDPIECLLGSHTLLAALRQTGWADFWSPYQVARLQRLPVQAGAEAAALADNLLVSLRSQQVEVLHLTPALRQDACRFDRGSRFAAPGPLASPLAAKGRKLAWVAGSELVCHQVLPSGLAPAWSRPWKGLCNALAWNEEGLWALQGESLALYRAEDGERLTRLQLPAPPLSLSLQGREAWVCGHQGELWLCHSGTIQRNWPGRGDTCFSFATNASHVIQCSGRRLHVLNQRSGRQHLLEVPQPCVLPPVLGPGWAVLVSYEGMVYHLALDQEYPRVAQARRPFSSFEPIMIQPVLAGPRLFLAGPEGQLAGWVL
ncbi:MAG: hypothetical protein KF760_02260 [Candidatus Eremiobacteraeota bacterium]|nr:hypothetical protein [Candidatus Eremiobacteraeota bacterium]MCW5868861.1 hypothetical protein [Candidatus Eremiobacteraeota bacterium]